MKKRILLVTQPGCGGAERMTVLYGKILEKAGYEIEMFMPLLKGKKNDLSSFIPKHWNTHIETCKYRFIIFKLYYQIKRRKPSVVFSTLSSYSFLILTLKKIHLINCKTIIRDCNMPTKHPQEAVKLSKLFYPMADVLISQTQEMKVEMVEYYNLPTEKIIVINNPVDKGLILQKLSETADLPSGHTNFMACSRIFPQKDFVTMLKAFAIVKKKLSNARLYIIGREGTDEYMQELYAIIKKNNLSQDVIFVGFQENPFKYLKQTDVFVLSSIYEGLPNAMLEAMYLGKPVAVTECIPYISQVVKNGVNGYTCKVKDFEKLAECMLKARNLKNLPLYKDINQNEEKIINIFNQTIL